MPKAGCRPLTCHCGDHVWAPLTRGYVTLVSPMDKHHLREKWYPSSSGPGLIYVMRSGKRLHRSILCSPDYDIDHRNGNGLDNRRENLRGCDERQNQGNSRRRSKKPKSSSFRGVHFYTRRQIWAAFISINNRSVGLGHFACEIDAAKAYDWAAEDHFGEFATLNFPRHESKRPASPDLGPAGGR